MTSSRRNRIPRRYADELLDGMAMDIGRIRYARVQELLVYCYRVAGTVGMMMAHVMGVRDGAALRHATDLGIAMQLTNICRDVVEDERRDRVYLPAELLGGDLPPTQAGARTAAAVAALLRVADDHYRSGRPRPVGAAGRVRLGRPRGAPHLRRDRRGDRPARLRRSGRPRGRLAGSQTVAGAPGARRHGRRPGRESAAASPAGMV